MKSVFILFLTQMVPAVARWLKKKYFTINDRRKTKRVKKEKVD